jgi:trehalose synthase
VFSAPEYIPDYLAGRSTVIHPGIDPLSHKNRDLYPHKLTGVLCNSMLAVEHSPVLTPPFAHSAKRLHPDGKWGDPREPEEIGLLYRPIALQVSRWDRLKGFAPLIEAFVELKTGDFRAGGDERHRHRLDLVRLVLAGPDPDFIADDPEAREVLAELSATYRRLDVSLQQEIVLLKLPMSSRKENALMVNGLQRCATVVVQNSIREGFGLTIAEAMWKRAPVLASSSCGARQQLVDGLEGRLVEDPANPKCVAPVLNEMLDEHFRRELWSRNAQRRVYNEFLVFTQLWNWLRALCRTATD